MLAESVYARLPVPLQHAAVSVFGWRWKRRRFGGIFRREVAGFVAREAYSPSQWIEYQTARLRELLTLAYGSVPHYRRKYDREGLSRGDLERFTLADLRRLPLTEKEQARTEPLSLVVDGRVPRGARKCPTSGSSGTPVDTWWTDADFQRSLALREARSCRPAGVSYGEPRATFSGRLVEPNPTSEGPYYRFNWFEKQVYYSSFHLSPARARAYVAALRRHRTVWITGYTHCCEQLALAMLEQSIPPPPDLRAIITTSEKLTPEGRDVIARAFGCRVLEEYGAVEDVFYACDHGDGLLRISPDAGIVEVLRDDGSPADPGEAGEIVATGFVRRAQPMIRYRIGDMGVLSTEPDPGPTSFPILQEVVGRLEDIVYGPDGRRTLRFHAVFTELPAIREGQVIQEALDRVRIKVVPADGYGPDTAAEIVRRVHQRLTSAVNVEVETVDHIPRTKAGKLKAVVNLMNGT